MIKDIRMVHSDGEYLLLETETGEKYRLLIDDSIRKALRHEAPLRLDESSLSPRDIQEHIRSGKSIEEIVSESGDSFEYVSKFAAPVLDELAWVLENAKAVRLVVAEDKFHEPTFAAFGDIISERIHNRSGQDQEWGIRRTETGQWLVSVSFQTGKTSNLGSWIFDTAQNQLEPQNATAIDLSSNRGELAAVTRPVTRPEAKPAMEEKPKLQLANQSEPKTEVPSETGETTSEQLEQLNGDGVDESARSSSLGPVLNFGADTKMPDVEPSGGLVDEIKRRREMAISLAATDAEHIEETQELPTIEEFESPEPTQPAPKKGRSSIPSWDEIVFGTKTEEPDQL